jgi:hypothetical protein
MKAIPQLTAEGNVLPESWEKSLLLLREQGTKSRKESYTNKSGVDEILESSMKIIVNEPLKEPTKYSMALKILRSGEVGTTRTISAYSSTSRQGRRWIKSIK